LTKRRKREIERKKEKRYGESDVVFRGMATSCLISFGGKSLDKLSAKVLGIKRSF
jgi:hypothetical protein